jgi:hypothetical protein
VSNGYPLHIEAEKVEVIPVEFKPGMIPWRGIDLKYRTVFSTAMYFAAFFFIFIF